MSEIHDYLLKCLAYISLLIETSKGRVITGYDIMVHMKEFGLKVSPGTVYNQIDMLEKDGIIKGTQVKRVKASKTVYEITDKGRKLFNEFKDDWSDAFRYLCQNIRQQ